MKTAALALTNLTITLDDRPIISNFSLKLAPGTIHALMGPNGSGKSTLAYTLMGHPFYTITRGDITIFDTNITSFSSDKRAQAGLFLAFQHPLEIPGLTLISFLHETYNALYETKITRDECKERIYTLLDLLSLDHSFAHRPINVGCSGGEKKKLELLQLLMLKPTIAILDEIDSGLDIDALKVVTHALLVAKQQNPQLTILIITHYQRILNYITPDYVHIMRQGKLICSGDASLAHTIEKTGYDEYSI